VGICTVGQWQCYPPGDPNYPMGRRCSAWIWRRPKNVTTSTTTATERPTRHIRHYLWLGNPPCTNCVGVQCDAAGECDWGFYRCGYGVGPNDDRLEPDRVLLTGVGDPKSVTVWTTPATRHDENFPEKGTPCDGEGECGTGVYECTPIPSTKPSAPPRILKIPV
jgi:hypothetical protein